MQFVAHIFYSKTNCLYAGFTFRLFLLPPHMRLLPLYMRLPPVLPLMHQTGLSLQHLSPPGLVSLQLPQQQLCFHLLSALQHLRLSSQNQPLSLQHLQLPLQSVSHCDPSKLLISTAGTDLTGPALAELLRSKYQIETEMSTADTVLCMTGMGDTADDLLRLATALNEIDSCVQDAVTSVPASLPLPKQHLPIYAAVKQETEFVPILDAANRIAADFLWAYPPGIPLAVPGEVISEELISHIRSAADAGVEISGPKGAPEGCLRVLKKG